MIAELLKPVLVLVVGFLLKLALSGINKAIDFLNVTFKIELQHVYTDDGVFNSIVLGVVVWLLSQLGIEQAVRAGLI